MEMTFEVVGEIKTKQRPRLTTINGYARAITPKDTVIYENYIRTEYQRQCNWYFGCVPLSIKVTAYFEPPQALRQQMEFLAKYMNVENKVICTTHKDFDNIYKIVCDSLNGVAYDDDKQIWNDYGFQKFYTLGKERLVITLENDLDTTKYLTKEQTHEFYLQGKQQERKQAKLEKLLSLPKLTKQQQQELEQLQIELGNIDNE